MPRVNFVGDLNCPLMVSQPVIDLNQGDLVVVERGGDLVNYMVTTYPGTDMQQVLFTNLATGDVRRKKVFPRKATLQEVADFLKADAVEIVDGAQVDLCINYADEAVKA